MHRSKDGTQLVTAFIRWQNLPSIRIHYFNIGGVTHIRYQAPDEPDGSQSLIVIVVFFNRDTEGVMYCKYFSCVNKQISKQISKQKNKYLIFPTVYQKFSLQLAY